MSNSILSEPIIWKAFLAHLEDYDSLEAYLKKQFGAKSRSKIRAYKKRLETCFKVRYKMFYGDISKKDYDFLFEHFLTMIKRRFEQRGDTHGDLKIWALIRNTTYGMILNKKASLFVIYDDEKPIDICLNYHFLNVLNNSIRSFDIDYSKFRLGHIDIYKQLEWCFENNHTIFDLSYGDLDYKRKWCNTIYEFEQHVVFPKKKLSKKLQAYIIIQLLKLKASLDKRKEAFPFRKVKSLILQKNTSIKNSTENPFEIKDNIELSENLLVSIIDINTDEYSFLRKPTYDFLYLNFESSNNISVYKIKGEENTFLIKGAKNNRLIKSNLKCT